MGRIFSIDASLRSTGWAVVDETGVIATGKLTTSKSDNENVDETIVKITCDLIALAKEYHADYIGLEDGFVGKSGKTSLQLAGLRQSIITGFYLSGHAVISLHPSRIRSILMGKGNAGKEQVAEFIMNHYGHQKCVADLGPFIDRACKAKNSDMYDAIAIGLAVSKTVQDPEVQAKVVKQYA